MVSYGHCQQAKPEAMCVPTAAPSIHKLPQRGMQACRPFVGYSVAKLFMSCVAQKESRVRVDELIKSSVQMSECGLDLIYVQIPIEPRWGDPDAGRYVPAIY